MRVTIIRHDGFVSVDGHGIGGIDMSGLSPSIHALQWYGQTGEVEYATDRFNEEISDLSPFQFIIDRWTEARDWLANKEADEFFDITLQEARDLKIAQIMEFLRVKQEEEYDDGANRLSPVGVQSIEQLTTLALLVKASGDTAWTTDVILADTNPNGTSVRVTLTADQIIDKIAAIKRRNEDLNQLAQTHIDNVMTLVSVEAIRDYELPT